MKRHAVVLPALWLATAALAQDLEVCVTTDREAAARPACVAASRLPDFLDALPGRLAAQPALTTVTLRFGDGAYELTQPIRITSATNEQGRVALRLVGNGMDRTLLKGSTALPTVALPAGRSGFDAYVDLAALPRQRLDGARAWTIGAATPPDFEVFAQGQILPRARWPATGFARVSTVQGSGAAMALRADAADPRRLGGMRDVRVGGYFGVDWGHEVFVVPQVEPDGTLRPAAPGPAYGARPGARVWVDNVDAANPVGPSWRLDRSAARLYLARVPAPQVDIAVTDTALRLDGARNVSVSDLAVVEFRAEGITGRQMQDVAIERVAVRRVGGTGIGIEGTRLRVAGCSIEDAGATGIGAGGGDRRTLTSSDIDIVDNRVLRAGRHVRTYAPAVLMTGVGVRVVGNLLGDGPGAAIVYHGNDHLVRDNEILRFVTEADDAGAIYTGQDWTERGTVIDGNLIVQVGRAGMHVGANAIYLDDQASGQTVTNNTLLGVDRGVFIGGGSDNQVTGNTIDARSHALIVDARGWPEDTVERRGVARPMLDRLRAMPVRTPPWSERYPALAALAADDRHAGEPLRNRFSGNRLAVQTLVLVLPRAQPGLVLADNPRIPMDSAQRAEAERQARAAIGQRRAVRNASSPTPP